MNMTRRDLVLALAAAALAPLPGCGRRREREEPPDLAVPDADAALAYALGALRERYGEGFAEVEGAGREVHDPELSRRRIYEFVLAPEADPGMPFGCWVHADPSDGRLVAPAYDDYTQYVFKEQVEGPYREAVAAAGGLAGYGVCLREPYMGDRVWRPDELEEYLANGYTRPRVGVVLMVPRDGNLDSWSVTISECLEAVWGLGRRMYVYAGVEGTDPLSSRPPLYTLDSSQTSPANRGPEPPDAVTVRNRMWVLSDDDTTPWDGYESWDGTGDLGDPGYAGHMQITWHPGHPVMG